jgi:hypothetical protein
LKYGVIVCRETENIGDDIQSYAAACLLPQVDYYIEREHMDVFRPQEQEVVSTIINGWFMDNKLGWPISPCINPLYLSMHFQEQDSMQIGDLFLTGIGGEDLKEHAPVGCRDTATQDILERNGIKTYFSGCVTLTLPMRQKKKTKNSYICLTDVSEETEVYIRKVYPDLDIRVIEHVPDRMEPLVNQNADWKVRFARVEELLDLYQNAEAVVTTRLHCAMPCLAMGVPVLFLQPASVYDPGRMTGLKELTHFASTADFLAGKAEFDLKNPPANPDTYLVYRKEIMDRVSAFVEESAKSGDVLVRRFKTYDSQWEKRALWKDELMPILRRRLDCYWGNLHQELEKREQARVWQENQEQRLKEEVERLREWITKQEDAKKYLEQEKQRLEKENKTLQNWTAEQEDAKKYLEQEKQRLEEGNKTLQGWTAQQEEAKQYLELENKRLLLKISELEREKRVSDEIPDFIWNRIAKKYDSTLLRNK